MIRFAIVLAALGLGQSALPAHDLWLIPPEKAKAEESAKILAISGMEFPKSEHAPDPAKFAKRRLFNPEGQESVLEAAGTEGKSGHLKFAPPKAVVFIVAVETAPKLITLGADAFNVYLISDGLPHIYRLRANEKSLDQPGR